MSYISHSERETGFEPADFSLARRRCTTQLLPRKRRVLTPRRFSAETQDRTADTAIFSRVLYQAEPISALSDRYFTTAFWVCQALDAHVRRQYHTCSIQSSGVVVARWLPRSSKPSAGRAERAAVGSTPIHPRLIRPDRFRRHRQSARCFAKPVRSFAAARSHPSSSPRAPWPLHHARARCRPRAQCRLRQLPLCLPSADRAADPAYSR